MSNRRTYRKIAKQNGVSVAEVKHDMQEALNYAYKNAPNDGVTRAYQNQVPRKGEVPTPDEYINYAVRKIKGK